MTSVHDVPRPSISVSQFEKREELRRVLESRQFAAAPKRARFLEFVCEQTFLGNGEKLNEYLIGVEVYGRGTEFNPQKDPIVRVQAHEIRRCLRKYYEENAAESALRIDLPAGHYIPVFSRSAPETADPEKTEPPALGPPQRPSRVHLFVTTGLALACAALVIALIYAVRRTPATIPARAAVPPVAEGLQWFWAPFLPPAHAPLIVIPNHPVLRAAHNGDSEETIAHGHEIPKADLPEFRDTIHFRELRRFIFVPSTTDFTAVGEALGVVRLCEMFFRVDETCRVQPSRLVNFEEIRNGNAILLGGSQAWSGRVFLETEGFHLQGGVILNRNPQAGEKSEYKPEFDPVSNQLTRDYALVLMLPNQERENRVLLIYGIYTQGSQAAIEYLTDPERMAILRRALVAASPDKKSLPTYFQALITTTVENAVPGTTSLVAVRRIPN
ncbi:MAG TPA: hypothetical protein VHE33_05365 [Acidobacteriaceae bacterium]|nr:hypothetical protein [Acidobacteriaceae bacterium]